MTTTLKSPGSLFPPISRIVDAVHSESNLIPLRQFKVLFPIWDVSIVGTQRQGQEYELLERFIERGIEEGNLRTAEDLSRFFGLKVNMVHKMLAFLHNVGHLEETESPLQLTRLGKDSLRDQIFYQTLESHRTFYLEAFGSHPLPREYYDLRLLTEKEAAELRDPYIYRLYNGFHDEPSNSSLQFNKLRELENNPERAKYNLPDEIRISDIKAAGRVYLPMCIIEARSYSKNHLDSFDTSFMVITRIREWKDMFFLGIISREPGIYYQLQDYARQPETQVKEILTEWLSRKHLTESEAHLEQQSNGSWRLIIEADLFKQITSGKRDLFKIDELGSYKLEKSYFFQIWCNEEHIRRYAAMERVLIFTERQIRDHKEVFKQTIEDFLSYNEKILQAPSCSWQDFENYMAARQNTALLDQLVE